MKLRTVIIFLLLLSVASFLVLSSRDYKLSYYLCYIKKPTQKFTLEKAVLFKIDQGESLKGIINTLSKNLPLSERDQKDLVCLIRKNNDLKDFKAGYFYFEPQTYTLYDIIERLKNPNPPVLTVTIPEGLRYDEIADIFAKKLSFEFARFNKSEYLKLIEDPSYVSKIFKEYEFITSTLKNLEGFLYPATYKIQFNETAEEILAKQLRAYNSYIHQMVEKAKKENNPIVQKYSEYEILILASIIERETTQDLTEKQMVADILLRRLENRMLLQTDATLLYPLKDWRAPITKQVKEDDNPYNTYKYLGLPPTPISNPGKDSVYAVLNPIPNQYWYYLHGKDGKIRYARTYQEHVENIRRYLR